MSNAVLARLNFVTPQTMMRMVGGLEGSELLERDLSGTGRTVRFKVSKDGRQKLEEAHTLVMKIEQQMVGALTPDEAALFLHCLDRCAEALST